MAKVETKTETRIGERQREKPRSGEIE